MDYNKIEKDLNNILKLFPDFEVEWGIVQNDEWDKDTHPYAIYTLAEFIEKWRNCKDLKKVRYALTRWFRYWCAKCDENCFCGEKAIPNPNKKDKNWDIQFKNLKNSDDIEFDVKSTRLPNSWNKDDAIDADKLIEWYYHNQSKGSRNAYQNRIFVVHIPNNGKTETKLRCDFDKKRGLINEYYKTIEAGGHKPHRLNVDGHDITADIIFVL
jgi:hypothetical protein